MPVPQDPLHVTYPYPYPWANVHRLVVYGKYDYAKIRDLIFQANRSAPNYGGGAGIDGDGLYGSRVFELISRLHRDPEALVVLATRTGTDLSVIPISAFGRQTYLSQINLEAPISAPAIESIALFPLKACLLYTKNNGAWHTASGRSAWSVRHSDRQFSPAGYNRQFSDYVKGLCLVNALEVPLYATGTVSQEQRTFEIVAPAFPVPRGLLSAMGIPQSVDDRSIVQPGEEE
jgi:hypothetical protein